ncbi:UNVERIFIED_CONTAM: hypothetical protein Slati_3013400 [Sesamum latifolium]|uniref:Reverse transcriptase/retrotransposon-derived protein RNase H-like domain-containing protein n=1 Tax=Sesamum latifolium TaxID=2727402 RepID=A0AAW2VJ74_9LAMI
MTVSNKTMERIMPQDSNLSPYDGFRIGGIGRVLNQIGLNQRRHHIIYKVSSGEFAIPMELTRNVMEMQLIPKEEILEELSKLREEVAVTMKWIHIGAIEDKRKFGKALLSFRQQGLIESDSFYEESEKEIINLKEALQEINSLDISEESRLSLENVKRLIQRNFSENPLAWWDRNKIEATLKVKEECKYEYVRYKPIQMNMEYKKDMQMIIKEHINLGLIEPGVSAYSSPSFLDHIVEKIRNFPDVLKDKKHLQSFLGVVNFAGIFIKDLVKYRKDFRSLLKETESSKWKWKEIHTQRVRKLKQVCNNLPKLAILQDEDELMVYTDANDYRWAAVLMKKTTTEEEPCRYTGVNSVILRLWHLRENLEELDREFGRLAVNTQVAGQVQRVDLDIVQTTIRSFLVASTALWNALQEPIRKTSPSVMTRELREHDPKHTLRVQGSRPVAADSSTACTRPSPDSGEKAIIESQGVQTSDDSSQPNTSGVKEGEISLRPMTDTSKANTNELISSSSAWQVYQRMWKKLISHKGLNPSKTIIETSKKYNIVWMLEGSKPEDVREWYDFGALASVHTMSPNFPKISKLLEWITGAVYDSWQNNPHLKRGDILELKFISAAPEMPPSEKLPWYQLSVKMISLPQEPGDYGSVSPRWTKSRKNTEFVESMFEKKRMLIWKNKLPATEVTRMKTCNMLHVGQWHNHVCPCCEKQE